MIRIVLATRNEGKVTELERLFAEPRIELVSLAKVVAPDFEVEETGATFLENAWLKAEAVARHTGLPALADDSGLEVDALGGRPGVYSARFAGPQANDQDNNALLLRELAGVAWAERTARFVCALAFAVGESAGLVGSSERVVRRASGRGTVSGRVLTEPRGSGGFGYDPLFEALETPGRTTAELSPGDKNRISHRGRAALDILPALNSWVDQAHR